MTLNLYVYTLSFSLFCLSLRFLFYNFFFFIKMQNPERSQYFQFKMFAQDPMAEVELERGTTSWS